eukprot:143142-Chlamydomonas_euryale.AAC.1
MVRTRLACPSHRRQAQQYKMMRAGLAAPWRTQQSTCRRIAESALIALGLRCSVPGTWDTLAALWDVWGCGGGGRLQRCGTYDGCGGRGCWGQHAGMSTC